MSAANRDVFHGGRKTILTGLIVAAIGLVGFIVALALDTKQALASYLIAYFYVVTIVLGLMAFVMGAYIMNAKWPSAVRRLAEIGFSVMPLLLVLYAPLFWSADRLYPWAHPEQVADLQAREIVLHKRLVMNAPFFYVRAILFLVLWTVVAEVLRRGSLRMDRPGAPKDWLRGFSSLLLPLVGLTGTFAAFDWLMSLSPDFYSTMYGLYVLSGGFVAAIGLIAILMRSAQLPGVNRSHWYAIGRLLFAFLIFWAYTGFFQYLLIWIANKPVEARFYMERFQPGDLWTSWFLVWGHFFVPWLLLLSYSLKRNPISVTLLGAWIVVCHYVDIHWLVGARRGAAPWRWEDLPALLLIGGLAVAFGAFRQRGHLMAPHHDPDYAAGIAYESR